MSKKEYVTLLCVLASKVRTGRLELEATKRKSSDQEISGNEVERKIELLSDDAGKAVNLQR